MKKIFSIIVFILLLAAPCVSQALTVSPPVLETELAPGESDRQLITLFNETKEEVYLSGYIETFRPKGERGEAEIMPPAITNQAVTWLRLPDNSLSLQPGEEKVVSVMIDVPKTAQAGGYYLAVVWETNPGPKIRATQVQLAGRIGVLMFLKVEGATQEDLSINSFILEKKQSWFDSLPVGFSAALENKGQTHLKPKGLVVIKNLLGVSETLIFNPEQRNILPQSKRIFENSWSRKGNIGSKPGFLNGLKREFSQLAIGRYSAQLQLEYGESQKRVSSERIYFWVWPWRLLLVAGVVLLLALILFVGSRIRKKTRR